MWGADGWSDESAVHVHHVLLHESVTGLGGKSVKFYYGTEVR